MSMENQSLQDGPSGPSGMSDGPEGPSYGVRRENLACCASSARLPRKALEHEPRCEDVALVPGVAIDDIERLHFDAEAEAGERLIVKELPERLPPREVLIEIR